MSVIRHVTTHEGKHYGYEFRCPGCNDTHIITTKPYPDGWDFDGNESAPSFMPSVLVHEVKREDGTVYMPRCHSYVRAGSIAYLPDCGHALAGQTVPLPEMPE